MPFEVLTITSHGISRCIVPKYDYKCDVCGGIEEIQHEMDEDYNGLDCGLLSCDGSVKKIITAPAVQFRGQGWGGVYRTYKPKKDT
jgi:putative FmdB family regulatory protein